MRLPPVLAGVESLRSVRRGEADEGLRTVKTAFSLTILSFLVALPAAAGVAGIPPVPEPTALGLFAVGAAVVAIGYRINRNR